MQRKVASLPESVAEVCLVRLGIQAHKLAAIFYANGLAREIDRSAATAIREGAGLLHSERFAFSFRHFGVLQYWRSFDDLERWSHRPPHSEWWRKAVERARTRGDFGIYHEAFLVPRDKVESIYVDCSPVGMSRFGNLAEAVGSMTTSRDRLGRRGS